MKKYSDDGFIYDLWATEITDIEKYLENHYLKFTGDKGNFLTKIKYNIDFAIARYEIEASNLPNVTTLKYLLADRKIKAEVCNKWLEKKKEIETTNSKKHTDNKTPFTYQWQSNPDKELPELYQRMKGKFIAEDTDEDNFKKIFSGMSVTEIKKITWTHHQKNLLAYFIDQLFDLGKIPEQTNLWQVANFTFYNAKTLINLKDSYQRNKNGKPKLFSKIDQLFENL